MKESRSLSYALPLSSAVLTIFSFPPFSIWYLGLVSCAPFIVFLLRETRVQKAFKGGALFGAVLSSYFVWQMFPGFAWLPQAHLFETFMKALSLPIIAGGAFSGGALSALVVFLNRTVAPPPYLRSIGIATIGAFFVEPLSACVFAGYYYASFAYIGVHMTLVREAAALGGTPLVAFLVLFINVAVAEGYLLVRYTRRYKELVAVVALPIIFLMAIAAYHRPAQTDAEVQGTLSVAIIQAGKEVSPLNENGGTNASSSSVYDRLSPYLHEALQKHPTIIIYPGAPWQGVITDDSLQTSVVGTTSFASFGMWLKKQLPPDVVFVAWGTALRRGVYTNEIEFWQNGTLVGVYQKRHPFPFMDYTPAWVEQYGFYTTPFDITAGTSTQPVALHSGTLAALVCSEITMPDIAQENAARADVIMAIGSEVMFSGSLAETYNLMNTQLRAAETGKPFIRANASGPSAIISANGTITREFPYGVTGVLFGAITPN